MLTLIFGRAGSGKTSYIYRELAELTAEKKGDNILIVPEQYSHDAERALAEACGDSSSLYAEVLSFSRLCSRVFEQTGGIADRTLDNGGRILAMCMALMNVSQQLKIYGVGSRRPDFIKGFLAAYDEMRSSGADAATLADIGYHSADSFGDKLSDLALIFDEYESIKQKSGCDVRDRLERLAQDICTSTIGDGGIIYIDGFTDFTYQELQVIRALMRKGANLTVALTCSGLGEREAVFEPAVKTANRLISIASRQGLKVEIVELGKPSGKTTALLHLEQFLMDNGEENFSGSDDCVKVYTAGSKNEECEFAAARTLELLRKGNRMRQIAVVSPDWENYDSIMREVFQDYGLTLGLTEKNDILEKPAVSHIISALQILDGNWRYEDIFKYLKTGILRMSLDERDVLENYVLKWSISGRAAWTKEEKWKMSPEGYSETIDEKAMHELEKVNELRVKVADPLKKLETSMNSYSGALDKVRAVYTFMEDTGLYDAIERRKADLRRQGNLELSDEYDQLWDIIVEALQQFADIMGDKPLDTAEFTKLLKLVLSQYKVGVIPAYVDCVKAGDMARVRARGIRHLIIVGAVDGAMPKSSVNQGIFTEQERDKLREAGLELLDSSDDYIARELGNIYASITVPSETLYITYPADERKSYIVTRIEKLLGIDEKPIGEERLTAAVIPCFELAVSGDSDEAKAAAEYFKMQENWKDKLILVRQAASISRGRLSKIVARHLYGDKLNISASRVDKYYSCRFSYFLQYGLNAKPRKTAGLDVPESGTFMHFVLERAVREIEKLGGFAGVSERAVADIVRASVREYAEKRLGGVEGKSGRFKYLYQRLAKSAVFVVLNMVDELRDSEFKPVDFELRFSNGGELQPVEINSGNVTVSINGVVDRVDGWEEDGKLYIRVVDYKTGVRKFNLSDVWYGMGMQMLIYLFALKRMGGGRYGKEIIPAGVLYAPARDVIVQAPHDLDDDELESRRIRSSQRSGLLLNDKIVLEAMERAYGAGVLPVKVNKDGNPIGDSLASLEQLGKLSNRVDKLIGYMGDELINGSVRADPYYKSQIDNACIYCDYFEACRFADGNGEDRARHIRHMSAHEAWKLIQEAE